MLGDSFPLCLYTNERSDEPVENQAFRIKPVNMKRTIPKNTKGSFVNVNESGASCRYPNIKPIKQELLTSHRTGSIQRIKPNSLEIN